MHHYDPASKETIFTCPAGLYAYQFEINGRRVRDESSGSIKLRGPQVDKGTWSLAVVPHCLQEVPA